MTRIGTRTGGLAGLRGLALTVVLTGFVVPAEAQRRPDERAPSRTAAEGTGSKRAASGSGRTISQTVLARVSVEDVPGHELVQSTGVHEFTTPDPVEGVSFQGAQLKTHSQADMVRGSGLVRGYGVWQARSGEKLFMVYGYGVPPIPESQSAVVPFDGTFELIGGTGRLANVRGKGTMQGKVNRRGDATYTWSGTYGKVAR